MKLKKTIRRLALLFAIAAVLGIVSSMAVRRYAKSKVVELLEDMTGGKVQVDDVQLGLQQTVVRGIRVQEPEGDEWLAIDSVLVDMSLWDAIGGGIEPQALAIRGAVVKLRFDTRGNLLTYIPESDEEFQLPTELIDIEDAHLEIDQQHRNPLIASNIDARIRGKRDLHIDGSVGNLLGTNWKMNAQVKGDTFATTAHATAQVVPFSSEQLNSLPFLPQDLAANVRFRGTTPVKIALATDDHAHLTYRLDISPESLDFIVPDVNLHLIETSGSIVIDNNAIEVEGLLGKLADGNFAADGRLTLQDDESWRGGVQVQVTEVTAAQLPASWSWPQEVQGVVSGRADLDLALVDARLEVSGRGQVTLDRAKLLGIAAQPMQVDLNLDKLATDTATGEVQITGKMLANIELRDVAVADLVKAADPESDDLREKLSGQVNCRVLLEIPLATATDPQTFAAAASLSLPAFQYDRLAVQDVSGKVNYADGVLTVRDLQGNAGERGQVTGAAAIQLAPRGKLTTDVELQDVAASMIAQWLGQPADAVQADVFGSLTATVPVDELGHMEAWQAGGKLHTDQLVVRDQRWSNVAVEVSMAQGTLALTDVAGVWHGIALEGTASLAMKKPFSYKAQLTAKDVNVKTVEEITETEWPVQVVGTAAIEGRLTGELDPLTWQASGNAAFVHLMIEDVKLESTACDWSVGPKMLRLTNAQTTVFGGDVQLSANIPLDGSAPNTVSGSFSELDAAEIQEVAPEIPVAVSGKTSGEFTVTGVENLIAATGHVAIRDVTVVANGMQLDETNVTVALADRKLTIDLGGKLFGGEVAFQGSAPLVEADEQVVLGQVAGNVTADHVPLPILWTRLFPQTTGRPPEGWAHVDLNIELAETSFQPTGKGRLELHDLRWQGKNLAPRLTTNVELLENTALLSDIALDYGGGRIDGLLQLRTDQLGVGSYSVTINRVDAKELLMLWPDLAKEAKGDVDVAFRGRFANRKIEGAGKVQVSRATVAEVPVDGVSAPVIWSYDTASRRGTANVRLDRAEIARGRVSGKWDIDWGRQIDIDGKSKVENIDVRTLARHMKFLPDQFNGRVSGNVELQGRNVRSIDDLSGTFQAKAQNSPMLQLPILDALANSFGIGSPAQMFSQSDIKGRLQRGTVYIDELTMVSSSARLYVEGKVTTRGRIDLDVTADTAQTLAAGVAVGLVRPADFLRRRLIFLHIGGSVRSPTVLPQTEKIIQQEIILFFLPSGTR